MLEDKVKSASLKYYIPAIVWGIFIFAVSTFVGINVPESLSDLFAVDKIGHLGIYIIFMMSILWGMKKRMQWQPILGFFIASCFGALMEIAQFSFFPGRYFELLDIVANIIGTLVGWIIFNFFHKNL